jgi:hypothetical protein
MDVNLKIHKDTYSKLYHKIDEETVYPLPDVVRREMLRTIPDTDTFMEIGRIEKDLA